MKKIFSFIIAILGIMVMTLTSCGKEENEVIITKTDTVVTTDTVYLVNGDHLLTIANHLLDQGHECDWRGITLDMNASYLDAEKYLIWLGYLGESGFHRWEYNPHHDERAYSFNFNIPAFYDEIVIPCYDYVSKLKEEGWGGTNYTTWMTPNDFINSYQCKGDINAALIAVAMARDYHILGI